MFEKRKKNREHQQNEENIALQNKLKQYLNSFDEAFAKIEVSKDAAEKIINLKKLAYQIDKADKSIELDVNAISRKRAKHTRETYVKKAALTVASLPIITGIFTAEADWTSRKSINKKTHELENKFDMPGFFKTTAAYRERAAEILKQTVLDCDLDETSKSRYFPDALNHAPLKKKFEAAAIARAALGHKDLTPEKPKAAKTKGPVLRKPSL